MFCKKLLQHVLGFVCLFSQRHEVVGIAPSSFVFRDRDIDYWVPMRLPPQLANTRSSHFLNVVARLKPGVSLAQANADVGRMLPIWIAERGTNANVLNAAHFGAALRPAKDDVIGAVGAVRWNAVTGVAHRTISSAAVSGRSFLYNSH